MRRGVQALYKGAATSQIETDPKRPESAVSPLPGIRLGFLDRPGSDDRRKPLAFTAGPADSELHMVSTMTDKRGYPLN